MSLPAFLLAVLLISASPGPAMALIVRRAALRGLRASVPTVLGLELGIYAWALFAGAGFAALVAASEAAYVVLRIVGAAVLLYLGGRALLAAWRDGGEVAPEPPLRAAPGRRSWWTAFGEDWSCSWRIPRLPSS
ncbi:LysE family translocator [Blastococcus brunescens]|uniref:LysE family transporter n=1 Tax=Blastococcus brunescens TaxID=1564165 RepID=A0ABZ1B6I5_9ACTN|nr:LysE family transporter [Blastococcus sp. BMG 8361]WRL66401.1 LysE family transporter [Blastococcus sp. BMG 8361]